MRYSAKFQGLSKSKTQMFTGDVSVNSVQSRWNSDVRMGDRPVSVLVTLSDLERRDVRSNSSGGSS